MPPRCVSGRTIVSEDVVNSKTRVCNRVRGYIVNTNIIIKRNYIVQSSVVVRSITVKGSYIVSGTVVTRGIGIKSGMALKVNGRTPGGLESSVCGSKLIAVNRGSIVPTKMRVKGGATVDNVAIGRSCMRNTLRDNKMLVGTNSES